MITSISVSILGDVVFFLGAASKQIQLLDSLTNHGKENNLRDITVVHKHTEGPSSYYAPNCKDILFQVFLHGWQRAALTDVQGDAVQSFCTKHPTSSDES